MSGPDSYREASSCEWTRRRVTAWQEGQLPPRERQQIQNHVARCPQCAEYFPVVSKMRGALKGLTPRVPSVELQMRLRVLASHEASRRRQMQAGRFAAWKRRIDQWMGELMRPLAIPTAGGFAAALLLFSMLAPSLAVRGASVDTADTPTGLYTVATIKSSLPFGYEGQDLLVDVSVDEFGRMIDYSIPQAYYLKSSPELRRNVENHLLTMVFNPATSFGMPTSGRIRLWFRTSRIDIKG
jgi:hypothetical protein